MIEVEMKTTYAGPSGTCQAGKKIHLPEKEAMELIEGGFAVAVEKPKPEKNEKQEGKDQGKDDGKGGKKENEKDKEKK